MAVAINNTCAGQKNYMLLFFYVSYIIFKIWNTTI